MIWSIRGIRKIYFPLGAYTYTVHLNGWLSTGNPYTCNNWCWAIACKRYFDLQIFQCIHDECWHFDKRLLARDQLIPMHRWVSTQKCPSIQSNRHHQLENFGRKKINKNSIFMDWFAPIEIYLLCVRCTNEYLVSNLSKIL